MVGTNVCWNCHTTVGMPIEGEYRRDISDPREVQFEYFIYFYLMSCPACEMPSLARRGEDDEDLELISTGSRGQTFSDTPAHIADPASEAHTCLSAGAYRAAILMARAVVEASCKAKGITSGRLVTKIEKLHAEGIINDQVYAEATEIRLLGNDMAHGDFDQEVTATDAEDMLAFMAEVIEEVFQRPARVQRRKSKRQLEVSTSWTPPKRQ